MSSIKCHIDPNQQPMRTNWVRCPLCNKVLVDILSKDTATIRIWCRHCKTFIIIDSYKE